MAVIIYGTRHYGRVESHGGEFAETRFFHIWFAPLIPLGSTWFTSEGRGHAIKLHAASVAAAYLRIWAPIVAIASFAAASAHGVGSALSAHGIGPALFGTLLLGLSALSWTWRGVRGDAARRRSDYNFVAFGTRCEPARMPPELRSQIKRTLARRWDERMPDRSPNDVAHHGASDAAEAVLAYGQLRIAAVDRGRAGRAEGADADRILSGRHQPVEIPDGPYRAPVAATSELPSGAPLEELVARGAEQRAAAIPVPAPLDVAKAQRRRGRRQLAGLVLLTFMSLGGIGMVGVALQPTLDVGLSELRGIHPPLGRTVVVSCDAVDGPIWELTSSHGKVTNEISICHVGKYFLPVELEPGATTPGAQVMRGKLREVSSRLQWVREGLHRDQAIEVHSLDVYLAQTSGGEDIALGIIGMAIVGATPVLWFLWFRARRRRTRAAAATSS